MDAVCNTSQNALVLNVLCDALHFFVQASLLRCCSFRGQRKILLHYSCSPTSPIISDFEGGRSSPFSTDVPRTPLCLVPIPPASLPSYSTFAAGLYGKLVPDAWVASFAPYFLFGRPLGLIRAGTPIDAFGCRGWIRTSVFQLMRLTR